MTAIRRQIPVNRILERDRADAVVHLVSPFGKVDAEVGVGLGRVTALAGKEK